MCGQKRTGLKDRAIHEDNGFIAASPLRSAADEAATLEFKLQLAPLYGSNASTVQCFNGLIRFD